MKSSVDLEQVALLSRRDAILRVSALLGGLAFTGGNTLLAAVERARPVLAGGAVGEFRVQDVAFLDEIAETILPATKTPGAKEAKTGAFIALMVTDCYSPEQQKVFREGMRKVDDGCRRAHGALFMESTPQQRLALLAMLDQEQKEDMDSREPAEGQNKGVATMVRLAGVISHGRGHLANKPAHYFRMMKELTLLGYFTSEIGCKQAMHYIEAPGRFDPCIPYTAGDAAWAQHA
jgi:hypothetical protein